LCVLMSYLFMAVSADASVAYPSDPVCQTLGRSSRDSAMTENVYLRKREQQCKIPISGGGIGLYTYSLNQVSVPVIARAMVFVNAGNLDKGVAMTDSGRVYAIKLGGQQAQGQGILGASLGGSGAELANIIPISTDAQVLWRNYEAAIYQCIRSGKSTSAKLRWIFYYRTKSDTRPYSVQYSASFQGGANNCENMVQAFDM
jgi:hypothetical protein